MRFHELPGMQSRVSEQDGHVALSIPAPGLTQGRGVRAAALALAGVVVIIFALAGPMRSVSPLSSYVTVLCGLVLLAAGGFLFCLALLDTTAVRLSDGAVEVMHSFPVPRASTMGHREIRGVTIGRPRLVARGYSSPSWHGGQCEVVVWSEDRVVHFGAGLSGEEQEWLRSLVESTVTFRDPAPAEMVDDAQVEVIQPPERLWVDVARYSACCAVAGLVLLTFFAALGADSPSVAGAVILVIFAVTISVLGYRSFRLERAASGWHRAVVKFLASKRGMRFSAVDAAGVGARLPDFAFFGGPRLLYNVAWSDTDVQEPVAFDFSCRGFGLPRDGVGCALQVERLSKETIVIRPRRFQAMPCPGGLKLPEYTDLMRRYCIKAENHGRARRLLGPAVVDTIVDWRGQGPAPWICLEGGMVGLCVSRRYATNDRAMRALYDYGRRLRRSIEDRLGHLRSGEDAYVPGGRPR